MLENNKIKEEYTAPKSYLYQMYFVIGKLDAPRLAKMDIIMNFGVSTEIRSLLLDIIENGSNYEDCAVKFELVPF